MQLLRSQKNRLFEEIEYYHFSPLQFSLSFESEAIITHLESDFYFKMKESRDYFGVCLFSPGEEKVFEQYLCSSFEETINYFSEWLDNVKRETEIEDKWERFLQEANSLNIPYTENESRFSILEFEILKGKIDNLKKELYNIKIEAPKLELINMKLNYLLEQGKHLNKNDWKNLFIGTFISIIIQLSISHEQGLEIWKIIKHIFGNNLLSS